MTHNGWRFVSNWNDLGYTSYHDMRLVHLSGTDLVRALAPWNPSEEQQQFLVHHDTTAMLKQLNIHRQQGEVRERYAASRRQVQALLVNHSAVVTSSDGGVQYFNNQIDVHEEPCDVYGVGQRFPRVWILGEQANPRVPTFPVPFATTAANHMMWPYIDPWYMRVSNCLQPDENPDDARTRLRIQWQMLGRPHVVLLGSTAARLFEHKPAVIACLDHPQYVWRFHHDQVEQWSQELRTVVWRASYRG